MRAEIVEAVAAASPDAMRAQRDASRADLNALIEVGANLGSVIGPRRAALQEDSICRHGSLKRNPHSEVDHAVRRPKRTLGPACCQLYSHMYP